MEAINIVYFSDLEFPSRIVAAKQIAKTADAMARRTTGVRLVVPAPWKDLRLTGEQRIERIRRYYGLSDALSMVSSVSPLPMALRMHRAAFSHLTIRRIARLNCGLICVRNARHLRMALRCGLRVLYETYRCRHGEREHRRVVALQARHRAFVGLVVHSEMARRYWLALGADPERTVTVHNGMDHPARTDDASPAEYRRRLNLPADRKVIVYAGNTGPQKGVESILDLAAALPEYEFCIVGVRALQDRVRLERQAVRVGASNCRWVPWMAPTEICPYLCAADALLIPPTRKPLEEGGTTVLPIKTFDYLAAGAVVLAPRLEDTAEILRHGENAWLLEPDQPLANARSIRLLFADGLKMKSLREAARRTSRQFTWESRAEKILTFLENRWS